MLTSLDFFLPGGDHVITVSDSQFEKIKLLFQALKEFQREPEVAAGIVYSLLMLVSKIHEFELRQNHNSFSASEKIAKEFKVLLSKNLFHHKDVGFYAQQLHVTPKYLSEVLLAETGKPAKQLINGFIFLEAKSLLRQTSMTINEICDWLGYTDSSYFTKAFKKREGMTPLNYRRQ